MCYIHSTSFLNVSCIIFIKVSENVFVRQEYKRKMSTGKAISEHGLHVIRTDDIVIIENDAADEVRVLAVKKQWSAWH